MLALMLVVAQCLVPDGPARARLLLPGGETAIARAGAIAIGERTFTACDGLPDPEPTALALWRGKLVAGFRTAGAFTVEDGRFVPIAGLPHSAVRALAASGDALYIGTEGGLWRVDPAGARRVSHRILGRKEVTALGARGGVVEVGVGPYGWWRIDGIHRARQISRAFAGCFVFSRRGVRARAPGPACESPAEPASGLPASRITALTLAGGTLYAGTFDHGLYRRLSDGKFTRVEGAPAFVNALALRGSTLFIGAPDGLYRLSGGRVSPVALGRALHVNGLASAPDGTLWLATGEGLWALGPSGVRVIDERSGLPSRLVYAVAIASDGAVWAGTAGGAVRLGARGLTRFTRASGALPHDWVTALCPDGPGAMLAGTYDAGVARLTPDGAGHILSALDGAWVNPNGLSRLGRAIAVATLGSGLWLAGPTGVERLALPSGDVTSLAREGATVWVGTGGGLVRLAQSSLALAR